MALTTPQLKDDARDTGAMIEKSRKFARRAIWLKTRIPRGATHRILRARQGLLHVLVDLRMRQGGLRCQPNFLILGAQKAGTTSLFKYLVRHQGVVAPITKEIRYFDWNWARPLDWYWAHFPLVTQIEPFQITGEASPFYLGHPMAAERVASVLPQVKMIALLRDPIRRAVSHYHLAVQAGWEKRGIEEALLADESLDMPDIETLEERGSSAASCNYIVRGCYVDQLERWFARFDRSQILILKSESLFTNPADVYAEVLHFLGLPPFQLKDMESYNPGSYRVGLSKDLLQKLADCYAVPNRRLYDLLGINYGWEREW